MFMAFLALLAGFTSPIAAASAGAAATPKATAPTAQLIRDTIPRPVAAGHATVVGAASTAQKLRVVISLRTPHPVQEAAFLRALQDRTSPLYHHFLTAAQWNARFAPTRAQQQAVVKWARSKGLQITKTYPDRLLVDTAGSVGSYERAFSVRVNNYRSGSKRFFSNAGAIVVPPVISGAVESVNGLDNYRVAQSSVAVKGHAIAQRPMPAYSSGPVTRAGVSRHRNGTRGHAGPLSTRAAHEAAATHTTATHKTATHTTAATHKAAVRHSTASAHKAAATRDTAAALKRAARHHKGAIHAPVRSSTAANATAAPLDDGLISPLNLWSSSGYDEGALYAQGHCCDADGTPGQSSLAATIAISTAGSFDFNDLSTYAAQCCAYDGGTTLAYNVQPYYIDGTPVCCNDETTLDVESATAMANSFGSYETTARVNVYEGANSNLGTLLDVDNYILSQNTTRVFTTSWGLDETDTGSSTMNSYHSVFDAMSGQGWTMNAASADHGSYDNGSTIGVDYPASDPDVVASGGSELHLNSDGTYNYETTWNGAGGGCSGYWATPSYQNGLSTGCSSRALPDVSLNASNVTAQVLYFDGGTNGNTSQLYSVWGTSEVAPELAGIWAVENSYLLSLGNECGGGGTGACAPLGDPHTQLYAEAEVGGGGRAPHYPFYDVTTGNNDDGHGTGVYTAGTGFDLATGWGSLNTFQLARAFNWERVYDSQGPVVTFSNPSPYVWYNTDQDVSWSVADPLGSGDVAISGVSGFSQGWDSLPADPYRDNTPGGGDSFYAGPQFPNATTGYLALSWAGQGCHTAYVEAWDNLGYSSGDQSPGAFCYDTSTPTVSVSIDGGAATTTSTNASLSISASNPTSGDSITEMRFSTDGTNYGSWQTYNTSGHVTLPSGDGTKEVYVEVQNEAGTISAPGTDTITLVSAPSVTRVSPNSGPTSGGTTVTVTGTGFTGATRVVFGSVAATSFHVVSSTDITAVSPAQAASLHNILVTTSGGTSAIVSADQFTYVSHPAVTGVSPNSGLTTGGTTVTITGTAFTGATKVVFGSVAATSFHVVSSTQITAVSPAQAASLHNILVTTPGGTSAIVSADQFTYVVATVPKVTKVSPNSGPTAGGTTVTLTGTGFTGATHVVFGSVAATSFHVVSSTEIIAVSPAQAASLHNILVTTPAGTSAIVTADQFTYVSAPAVTKVSPNSGPPGGGTTVTITGTGFTGATKVLFGTVAATSFHVVSSTQITAVSPAQSPLTHNIYITTPGGTSAQVTADEFTYT